MAADGASAKTLVFCYSYGMGGWGDLLKGLHTCWCWAKATGRELRIDFSRHVFGTVFPQYGTPLLGAVAGPLLNLIDKGGQIGVAELRAMEADACVFVACNWFSPKSVEGCEAAVVLEFYEKLYSEIFPVCVGDGAGVGGERTYRVFHCRMGDKYLAEAYCCKGDNRIGSMSVLTDQIRAFDGAGGDAGAKKTMVCSDHASVIRSLLNQIPGSFCVCTEPYHIAYNSPGINERIGAIRAMIYEHFMMSRAAEIWMAVYSGFPITAAMVGDVCLKLGGAEYTDEYVAFVRGLRSYP